MKTVTGKTVTVARSHQSKKVFRCEQLTPVSVLLINPEIGQDLKRTPSIVWGYPILVLQGLNFRKLQKVPLESVRPSQECQAGFVESVPSLSLFEFGSSFFSAPHLCLCRFQWLSVASTQVARSRRIAQNLLAPVDGC